MFNAAFEILYAGDNKGRNASAIAIEPRVVDLLFGSASYSSIKRLVSFLSSILTC